MTQVYAADHLLPVAAEPVRRGAVAVREGLIVAVGPRDEVLAAYPRAEVEELGAAILMPALVNAHTHLEYAMYGGFGDGLGFADWLADHVARRPLLQPGDTDAAARLGALLALRCGVGTVADASYSGVSVAAVRSAGLRAVVHLEVFGGPDTDPGMVVAGARDRLAAFALETTPLVRIGLSPHSPYTVAPASFAALDLLARERGLTVMTHVAESSAELEAVADGTGPLADALRSLTRIEATGMHPVDLLADAGLLHEGALLVHVVQAGPAQIRRIAGSGAVVVHCPRSNAVLGCGAAPIVDLLAAGVTVALGTDSPASAIDFDMWAEMREALMTARRREGRPDVLTATDVLRMATISGARALGLERETGALVVGLRADLTAIDLADSPFVPVADPTTAAVFAGRPERVLLTVVDGVVRYRRGADPERIAAAIAQAAPGRARMIGSDD